MSPRMISSLAASFALAVLSAPAGAQMSAEAQKLSAQCDGGKETACIHLGIMQRHGIGAPQDTRGALTRYVEACEKGLDLACAFTGDMAFLGAGVARSPEHGEILMRRACAQENEWACETLRRHGLIPRGPQS